MTISRILMLIVGFAGMLSVFWIGFNVELTLGMSFLAIPLMLMPSIFMVLQVLPRCSNCSEVQAQ